MLQTNKLLLLVASAALIVDWCADFTGAVSLDQLPRLRRGAGSSRSKGKGDKSDKGWDNECLKSHNRWRRLHQAPDLIIDSKITAFAQKRADFIAKSDGDEFRHPPDLPFGENLAWHSRASKSCDDLIKMWYDEIELYDFTRGQFSHETGHFTQLVWKNTRRVGCARAISSGPRGGVYLVCNYDPPGNYLGEAIENVLRRIQSGRATTTTTTTTTSTAATKAEAPSTTTPSTTTTTTAAATTTTPSPPTTARSASPSTQRSPDELKGSTTTTKKPNKKKSNGKRKNKKGNKKGNNNKRRNKKNKKKNKKQTTTTTTTTTQAPTPSAVDQSPTSAPEPAQ